MREGSLIQNMSSDSEKAEEAFPSVRLSESQRRPSDGSTTETEKMSVDAADTDPDPVSPATTFPPRVHDGAPGEKERGEEKDGGPLRPARSTASSTRPRRAIPIPRESRRGLVPWLSLVPEVDNPRNYDNNVKWMLTVFVAAAACAAPMGSSIFYRESTLISPSFSFSFPLYLCLFSYIFPILPLYSPKTNPQT